MTESVGLDQEPRPFDAAGEDVLDALKVSSADRILIYLAMSVMKLGGHRYGAFLDAATTAAKFAVYSTYIEQGRNIRKTSFLHHVEPKRVRTIIKEVEAVMQDGRSPTALTDQEPYYLIGVPYLWQEKYPWDAGMPRLQGHDLTPREQEILVAQLPADTPPAQLLDLFGLLELVKILHAKSQSEFPSSRRMGLSEALTEHIKFRLLHSGTVQQIDTPFLSIPVFALARNHYAPRGEKERVFTMIDDVARFYKLMQGWTVERRDTLRALEVFDVDASQRDEALEELDRLLQDWADKYHRDGGHPMILQLAAGTREPGDA